MFKIHHDCSMESEHPNDGFDHRNRFVLRLLWGEYLGVLPWLFLNCGDPLSDFPHHI